MRFGRRVGGGNSGVGRLKICLMTCILIESFPRSTTSTSNPFTISSFNSSAASDVYKRQDLISLATDQDDLIVIVVAEL